MENEPRDSSQAEPPASPASETRVWTISIFSGILSSAVFLVLFQPIISLTSKLFAAVGGTIFTRIVDGYYASAVVAAESSMLFQIISFFIGALWGLEVTAVVFSAFLVARIGKKSSKPAIEENENSRLEKIRRLRITAISLIAFGSIFSTLAGTSLVAGSYIKAQARASFDIRLMAIAPYASDEEKNAIVGQWAWVNSRKSYESVMKAFEEVAIRHQKKLPEPFI